MRKSGIIEATKIDIQDEQSLQEAGELLKNSLELDYAVITLSEDGMAIFGNEITDKPNFSAI